MKNVLVKRINMYIEVNINSYWPLQKSRYVIIYNTALIKGVKFIKGIKAFIEVRETTIEPGENNMNYNIY